MARRSPMNERYQKNTAPAGKTRRSAASAKPKRDQGKGSSSPSKKPAEKRPPLVMNPPTEEFRRWRRIWWILLGVSLVCTFGSLAVRQWLAPTMGSTMITVANALLIIGYAGIFSALYIDWTKLRGMRREWMELQKSGKVKAVQAKPTEKTPAADDADAAQDES